MTHISGQSMPLPWWYSPLEETPTHATPIIPDDAALICRAANGEWIALPEATADTTAAVKRYAIPSD